MSRGNHICWFIIGCFIGFIWTPQINRLYDKIHIPHIETYNDKFEYLEKRIKVLEEKNK